MFQVSSLNIYAKYHEYRYKTKPFIVHNLESQMFLSSHALNWVHECHYFSDIDWSLFFRHGISLTSNIIWTGTTVRKMGTCRCCKKWRCIISTRVVVTYGRRFSWRVLYPILMASADLAKEENDWFL